LIITLAAVVTYSWYITRQIAGLRQTPVRLDGSESKDSLQLLRIQNDLNSVGLAMRDMLDGGQPYPLTAWSAQFQRLRTDLDDAVRREAQVAPSDRTADQQQFLANSFQQFWTAVDQMLELARAGKDNEARDQIRVSLQARQAALSTTVARLLVENNEIEEQTAQRVAAIYDRVQRNVYWFLTATLVAIALTSAYLIRSNRRLFAELASLSEQRHELAQKLIATREATLRHIARELHDEFGQVLTAMGSMLERARKHAPEGSPLKSDLREIAEVAQNMLTHVRSLSQTLHPSILEQAGLESTIDWYLSTVERQTGVTVSYQRHGPPIAIDDTTAIHVYRVMQEALNNVAKHSGAKQAWVRLRSNSDMIELDVEDHGTGTNPAANRRGWESSACESGRRCSAVRSNSSSHRRRHAGPVENSHREQGRTWRIRSPFSWPTTIAGAPRIPSPARRRPAIAVVGEASDGDEAVTLAASLNPQVIVMDCAMPGTSGLVATKQILQRAPETAVLMLSMHSEGTLVRQAMDSGARGYILKDALDLDLAAAVKKVAAGETVLDPKLTVLLR
jgi:signal transduction histidine kinase/CheY-like chemotaxis protein